MLPIHRLRALLAASPILAATAAVATPCQPVATQVYVGNTATDNRCDYDDIQVAIDAVTCPGTIVVSSERSYTGQHLLIAGKSLTLLGHEGGCGLVANPTSTSTTDAVARIPLIASDGIDQAVVTITGNSHVTLDNFDIGGGRTDTTTNEGGGIVFLDQGSLALNNVDVSDNHARDGGGIAMIANGGHADLVIGANTTIHHNIALHNGGGVYIEGDVHMTMVADQSAIYANQATGDDQDSGFGGGIYLLGGRADIGSPGLSGCPGSGCPLQGSAITGNSASFGGGIFVKRGAVEDGIAVLFTTDPSHPVRIDANTATYYGGAFFALGAEQIPAGHHGAAGEVAAATTPPTRAAVCLFNADAGGNQALMDGSVARVEAGSLYVNDDPDGICERPSLAALGATDCTIPAACNLYSGNDTYGDVGAVFAVYGGDMYMDRVALRDNDTTTGLTAVQYVAADSYLRNCLIADNRFAEAVAYLSGSDTFVDGCTMAGNQLDGDAFFLLDSSFDTDTGAPTTLHLANSIVLGDADDLTVAAPDAASTTIADNNLLSDLGSAGGTDNFSGDPWFVDPANGDYHLLFDAAQHLFSPAIDHAPAAGGSVDLDGRPRNFDFRGNSNVHGPRDLGAYEARQACYAADTVFCNGFEPVLAI